MVKNFAIESLRTIKQPRGRNGFDVGLALEAACRVTLGHVKTGELKINANDNYALAA